MSKTIRRELLIPRPREEVWRAIANSAALAEWMFPNDFEPRIGHQFTFKVPGNPKVNFEGLVVRCEVLECEPPVDGAGGWLVFTWSAGGPVENTRVSFRLEEEGDGTRLVFEHSGFDLAHPWGEQALAGAAYGWGKMFKALAATAAELASFHAATFQLLGAQPPVASTAVSEVERAEQRLGFRLPASVREWYCMEGAIHILAEHSNQDPPIHVNEFAVTQWKAQRLLPFRNENQGVCVWAINLDGSDDPPVFVDGDSGGREWIMQAPTFSAYVRACVWDHKIVLGQPALAQAQNAPLSLAAIMELTRAFATEPKTSGWPGSTQLRFSGKDHAILIWASETQADWFVAAPDEKSLETVLRAVWKLDDVGKSLYDCSAIAKGVLAKIREVT